MPQKTTEEQPAEEEKAVDLKKESQHQTGGERSGSEKEQRRLDRVQVLHKGCCRVAPEAGGEFIAPEASGAEHTLQQGDQRERGGDGIGADIRVQIDGTAGKKPAVQHKKDQIAGKEDRQRLPGCRAGRCGSFHRRFFSCLIF